MRFPGRTRKGGCSMNLRTWCCGVGMRCDGGGGSVPRTQVMAAFPFQGLRVDKHLAAHQMHVSAVAEERVSTNSVIFQSSLIKGCHRANHRRCRRQTLLPLLERIYLTLLRADVICSHSCSCSASSLKVWPSDYVRCPLFCRANELSVRLDTKFRKLTTRGLVYGSTPY